MTRQAGVHTQMVRILGLDIGTANTGFSILQGDLEGISGVPIIWDAGMMKTKKTDGDVRERIDMLGDMLRKKIHEDKPTHIVMEDFIEQGKLVGKTYKEMAFLLEHFRMVARYEGYEVTIYTNAEWKKKAIGSAGLNKTQVMHFVEHKLPDAKKTLQKFPDHVWDSVAIGYCKWLELKTL